MKLDEFAQVAAKQIRSATLQDSWLDNGAIDPMQLPVDHIVFACVEGQRKKCPAATLRGKCCAWDEKLQGADGTWQLFLAYTPGFSDNFAKPATRFTLAVGQQVECAPPLLVADKELAKKVMAPKESKLALVLGMMSGEEYWNSNSSKGSKQKRKSETRRFVVVEIDQVVYFSSFEQLNCKHDPAVVSTAVVRESVRKAFEAGLERTPSQAHSALGAAIAKEKKAKAIEKARGGEAGEGGAYGVAVSCAAGAIDLEASGGRRASSRQRAAAASSASAA
eukprot:3394418-Pleurochrysis_carterae.AAC.1